MDCPVESGVITGWKMVKWHVTCWSAEAKAAIALYVAAASIIRGWKGCGETYTELSCSNTRTFFYYLEQHRLLDPLNESDLYALHNVYLPRINRALSEFKHQHNYHPLRTEHNLTPMQMFELSPWSPEADRVDSMFGVEDEGPFPDLKRENCGYISSTSQCESISYWRSCRVSDRST